MKQTVMMVTALVAGLSLAGPAAAAPAGGPVADASRAAGGWAGLNGGTTGGLGAPAESVTVVRDRAALVAALANGGNPAAPKIVLVAGTIEGNQAADGRLLGEQDYAPGYDLEQYKACFIDGTVWSDTAQPWCKATRQLRTTGSNAEKAQIQITVPANTTLAGLGRDARLNGVDLTVNAGRNIIIRNLTLEAPVDYFTSWDPGDGAEGSWNARFDALSVVTGINVWIDHCTFTDGRFPDSEAPIGFHDRPAQRHDGLLDIEDGSDFMTISASIFENHDKTMLVGSGDSRADRDRGHLRITYRENLFRDSLQRSPRVRFGEVHSYNNVFSGSVRAADYPMTSEALGGHHYFLGMGIESKLVSEYNVFRYDGKPSPEDVTVANLKGNTFVDRGSWVNGRPADLNAVAARKYAVASAAAIAEAEAAGVAPPVWATAGFSTDVGWDPRDAYEYHPLRTPGAVTAKVLRTAGAGR